MKTAKKSRLDAEFWSRFARQNWEQKPMVLKNVDSPLLEMDHDQIFTLLILFADRCRKSRNPEGFKFYIDGTRIAEEELLTLLPVPTDRSLQGYHLRMHELFDDYCLVCDELLQVNREKQALLNDFTSELYQRVGFPNRFSEMGLYLGNYRRTPFGVHVDRCGVFSFPVVGKKTFRLWTSGFARKHPDLDRSFRYAKYNKHSRVLEVGPGDMAYWPSSTWHIAESKGGFNATWSLGVWVDRSQKDVVIETLGYLVAEKLPASALLGTMPFKKIHRGDGRLDRLPEAYLEAGRIVHRLKSADIQDFLLKAWMKHVSRMGFKTNPQSSHRLRLGSRIMLQDARAKILWAPAAGQTGKILLAFGGNLIESSISKGFLRLVRDLNAGQTCIVGEYLRGSKRTRELAFLQRLAPAVTPVIALRQPAKRALSRRRQ